jgi:hypothetical protein
MCDMHGLSLPITCAVCFGTAGSQNAQEWLASVETTAVNDVCLKSLSSGSCEREYATTQVQTASSLLKYGFVLFNASFNNYIMMYTWCDPVLVQD